MALSIHPTAIVDSGAELGADVVVGPHAIIEAGAILGDRCRLGPGAIVRRYTTLGVDNVVDAYAVLGGDPQDFGFESSLPSYLRIGDRNVFREGFTASRATGEDNVTVIGDDNLFMTAAHIGHNVTVGARCIMTNGSAIGGYAELGDRVILSAHAILHQHCWIGAMAMIRGNCAAGQHVPPYCVVGRTNQVFGLNRVGLRRAAHISSDDAKQIAEAYRLLYRSGKSSADITAEMDAHTEWGEPAMLFTQFVRRVRQAEPPYNRGLCMANSKRIR